MVSKTRIHPGEPADYDLYESHVKTPTVPGSLGASLAALAVDHDFLLEGGVFTTDLIETYIDYKQVNEADVVSMRPHPYEFNLYLDAWFYRFRHLTFSNSMNKARTLKAGIHTPPFLFCSCLELVIDPG